MCCGAVDTMAEFVNFEDVDWEHLQKSEENFRRRHERRLAAFREKALRLQRLTESVSAAAAEPTQASDLQRLRLDLERLRMEAVQITDTSQLRDKLSAAQQDFDRLKHCISTDEQTLKTLEQQKEELIEDRKLFINEVQNKYSAFISAKDYFKKKLSLYYTIEGLPDGDEIKIFVQFFTTKKLKNDNNSITLLRNRENSYKLTETKPPLPIFSKLAQRLEETGDIRGLICCIRQCFIKYHKSTR